MMRRALLIGLAVSFVLALIVLSSTFLHNQAVARLPPLPALSGQAEALVAHLEAKDAQARQDPFSDEAVGALGMAYQSSNYYDQALACFSVAADLNRAAWQWEYSAALILDERGMAAEAVDSYRLVVGLDPGNGLAWYRLGRACLKLGRFAEAEAAFLRAVDAPPVALHARFDLARLAFKQAKTEDAQRMLEELLEQNPTFGAAHRLLGRVLTKKSQKNLAADHQAMAATLPPYTPPKDPWVDALARSSSSSTYLLKQMGVAKQRRNAPWAETLARRAVEVDPGDSDAAIALGLLLLDLNRPDEAVRYLNRYHALMPDDYQRLSNFGVFLSQHGRLDAAKAMLEEALRIEPDFAEAMSNLATILSRQGRAEEAMSLVERALALKPGDAEILTNTGTLLARTGKHKEALAHYQRAIGIDPAYASAHLGASSLLALEAKWPQVVEHLHAARQLDPDDPQAMERLAWLLATCPVDDLRDGAQALALAERANHITGKQQVRFLNTLAAALAESGHFGRARETIARAIAILEKAGRKQAADRLAAIVRLYASNKPYRQGR